MTGEQAGFLDAPGDLDQRHLRMLRAIQATALQEISAARPGTAARACAALIAAVRAEREILASRGGARGRLTLAQILEARQDIGRGGPCKSGTGEGP